MTNFANNIQNALNQYKAETETNTFSFFSNPSNNSKAAVQYLKTQIQNNAPDSMLRKIILYLLGRGKVPTGIPNNILPLNTGGRLYNLLTNALKKPVQNPRKNLIVLLNGWDWIQLTNVHKYVVRHRGENVDVTTLTNLTQALPNLGDDSKIYVIGHGDQNRFDSKAGTTPRNLATSLNQYLPLGIGITIRVDTCFSAFSTSGDTTAQTIKNRLVECGRNADDITVSGTKGPSVTGIEDKKIVVSPQRVTEAFIIQTRSENTYSNKIKNAKNLVGTLNNNSSGDTIKQIASQVSGYTKEFFNDFEKALKEDKGMVVSHTGRQHKQTY